MIYYLVGDDNHGGDLVEGFVKYCPRCARVYTYDESKKYICDFCSTPLVVSDITNEDRRNTSTEHFIKQIMPVIESNPLYNKDASERRKEEAIAQVKYRQQSRAPKCPHCGHDKFQMVARKWSLLTGFLTNKVDRVCEKCKRRF